MREIARVVDGPGLGACGLRARSVRALQHEYTLGHSGIVTPAPLEDLRKAELEWDRLAELVEQLKQPR